MMQKACFNPRQHEPAKGRPKLQINPNTVNPGQRLDVTDGFTGPPDVAIRALAPWE